MEELTLEGDIDLRAIARRGGGRTRREEEGEARVSSLASRSIRDRQGSG